MQIPLQEGLTLPEIPEIPEHVQRPRPLDGNLNWDLVYFESESVASDILSFVNSLFQTWVVYYQQPRSPQTDFEWFTSAELDLKSYRGRYIAVFDKQIVGWGKTSKEAYDMAKGLYPNTEPALTYVPEEEDSFF